MFCTKCGQQLSDDSLFCPYCGQKVVRPEKTVNRVDEVIVEATQDEEPIVIDSVTPETTSSDSVTSEVEEVKSEQVVVDAVVPVVTANNVNQGSGSYQSTGAASGQSNGTSGGQSSGASGGQNSDKEKINWKEFLTPENIERFAPIAALIPLAMAVVVPLLGIILFSTVGRFGIGYAVSNIVVVLLKIIFVAATAAALAGAIYVIVKTKDMAKIFTWVVPVTILIAFMSCLGIAFGWKIFAWITGAIAVIIGLELVPRIVIANQPMDSAINPGAAFSVYKRYYADYRAKYPTTKDLEKAGIADPENSKFDGSGLELLGYMLLSGIVCAITCGIAAPWMICKVYRWRTNHTVINGKRLTFTGTGGSLLGHWILWELLTIVTCGIYAFFLHVALRKWELNHTYIAGEPIVANGNESYFDGGSFAYFGYSLLCGLLLIITCGLSYPWVMSILQKWDASHQVINHRRLAFSGSGLGFLGEFLIIAILTLITCGIYAPWGTVRLNKYVIRHTDFIN